MSGAQKISLSLLISIVVFSALAVLAAVDRFQLIETRFYIPRVEESVRMRAADVRDVYDRFHRANIARFEEFTLEPAVRAAFRINASAAEIRERRNRLDTIEQERASLDLVRIIDVAATQLHYSSNPDDYTASGTQRTYERPDEVSTGEPRSLGSLAYYDELPETEALPSGETLPEPEIFLEPENNQFIYRLPSVDTTGVLQGAALFYVNTSDLRTALIRAGLVGTGDVVRIVNASGVVTNAPTQFSGGLAETVDATWADIADLDGRETVSTEAASGAEADDTVISYEAFPVESDTAGVLVFLEPSASLRMPEILQYTLLVAVFMTTFLIVFLLLNVRQDAIVVIAARVKRFQLSLLREYMENRRELDFERWKAELEERRDEVHREIRRGIGRIKPSQQEEVDRLINESWDEIISVLSSRAEERPAATLDVERIEEIVDQLTRRLEQSGVGRPTPAAISDAPSSAPGPTRQPEAAPAGLGEPVEVEEISEDDELEEMEAVEEIEEAEPAEAAGEIEEIEEVEEVEQAEEPEAASAGLGEPVEVEEVSEDEELKEMEAVEEIEDPEPAEAAGEIEEIEEVEEAEETEPLADSEADRGLPGAEAMPEFPADVSLENLDEAAELEWLANAEAAELPGPVFARERGEYERPGLEEGSIGEDEEPEEPEEISAWDADESEHSEASAEAETAPSAEAGQTEELEEIAEAESEIEPVEELEEIEEAEPAEELEPAQLESAEPEEALEDDEELEELEPEEAGGEPVAAEELRAGPAGATAFGGGLFSFGRGIEVRLRSRDSEPAELEAETWETGPAEVSAAAQPPAADDEAEEAQELEGVDEADELEEIGEAGPGSSEGAGNAADPSGGHERKQGSAAGLIRFQTGREGIDAGYEAASLSELLDRLHIGKQVLVEHEGVVEIDRSAYAEGRMGHDEEIRSLVDDVIGDEESGYASGIESLFGGGHDELLSVLRDAGDDERRERRANQLSLFRFVEQGFDYDGFLRGYQNNDGGILKSLVRFTRLWNARVGIVLVEDEHGLTPTYQLGLDPSCADSLGITASSGLYRHLLSRRRVVFIEEPIMEVEYFHDLCSPESLSLFDRTLILPLVFRGANAYALLGLPRSVESLDDAFRSVVPYLSQKQGALT